MSNQSIPVVVCNNKAVTDGDFSGEKIKVSESGLVHVQFDSPDMGSTDAIVKLQVSLGNGPWADLLDSSGDAISVTITESTHYLLVGNLKPGSYIRVVFTGNTASSGVYSITALI